jgi:hypothetical protein
MDHYFDEGCTCEACCIKRIETRHKLTRGIVVEERLIHTEAKTHLIQKRIHNAVKINNIISKLPTKFRGKDFREDMTSIVSRGKRLKYYLYEIVFNLQSSIFLLIPFFKEL